MTTTTDQRFMDQALHDVFVTAIEGGVNYWAQVDMYRWAKPDRTEDLEGFMAVLIDTECGDGSCERQTVNREVVARGWALAAGEAGSRLGWSIAQPPAELHDEEAYDDLDLDAGDADMIVQFGLFGEVVYG